MYFLNKGASQHTFVWYETVTLSDIKETCHYLILNKPTSLPESHKARQQQRRYCFVVCQGIFNQEMFPTIYKRPNGSNLIYRCYCVIKWPIFDTSAEAQLFGWSNSDSLGSSGWTGSQEAINSNLLLDTGSAVTLEQVTHGFMQSAVLPDSHPLFSGVHFPCLQAFSSQSAQKCASVEAKPTYRSRIHQLKLAL